MGFIRPASTCYDPSLQGAGDLASCLSEITAGISSLGREWCAGRCLAAVGSRRKKDSWSLPLGSASAASSPLPLPPSILAFPSIPSPVLVTFTFPPYLFCLLSFLPLFFRTFSFLTVKSQTPRSAFLSAGFYLVLFFPLLLLSLAFAFVLLQLQVINLSNAPLVRWILG